MRVAQRTSDSLVIEDAPDIVLGAGAAGLGVLAILIGWIEELEWIVLAVGILFVLFGLKMLLFSPTTTHRFDRRRGVVAIETRKRWRVPLLRELPLDSIAEVVLVEKGESGNLRYWVEYVSTQGERIAWSDFTGSKSDKVQCVEAVREFLTAPRAG